MTGMFDSCEDTLCEPELWWILAAMNLIRESRAIRLSATIRYRHLAGNIDAPAIPLFSNDLPTITDPEPTRPGGRYDTGSHHRF